MKKILSSLFVLVISAVLLNLPKYAYAANSLYYAAGGSNGITASGADISGSTFFADTTSGNRTIYFNVDDGVMYGNSDYKNVTVTVEYIDSGEDGKYFAFEYDSLSNPQKRHEVYGETVNGTASAVRTAVFKIEDAYFKNRRNNADFSIVMPKTKKIIYFKKVTVEISDKTSGVEISASTKNFGNIFFKNDEKSIDVSFKNLRNIPVSGTAVYSVYSEAENTVSYSEEKEVDMSAGASVLKSITIPAQKLKYGTYVLKVNFSNTAQNIDVNAEIPFSVSTSVSKNAKNDKIGVVAHFNWGRRKISESIELLDKTGFSHIREGYSWTSFETVNSENQRSYGALDVCTEYIDKAFDNDMKTLVMAGYGNAEVLKSVPEEAAAAAKNNEEIGLYYLPVTSEGRKAYVDYILKLLEIYDGKIDVIEVWNEPNLSSYCSNAHSNISDGAKRYAALLKDTYTAVKEKYPSVKVAGPVISSLMTYADAYLKSFFAQTDINNYYDVFSFHNYSYSNEGLDNVISSIRDDLALIGADKEVYVTEFGVSNSVYSETKDEQYQAAGLAKYYLSMAAENFCDRYYIYQLSSVDTRSESLGMLDYHDGKYPYAARPSFVAMANVNSLTAGSEGKGYTALNSNVRCLLFENSAKHTKTDVYFCVSGTESVSVTADGKLIEFYDMFGNLLSVPENGGVYSLTVSEKPIYVVTYYMDKLDVSVDYEFGEFTVSGNIYTSHKNEVVTIKVFDAAGNLMYIDQTKLDDALAFDFKFVPLMKKDKYIIKLGNASFDEIHTAEYTVPSADGKISVSASKRFNEITLSGTVKTDTKNEIVTLKVFDKDGALVYINQTKTDANGGFELNFIPLKASEGYLFYISCKSVGEIYTVNFDEDAFSGLKLKPLGDGARIYTLDEYNRSAAVEVAVSNGNDEYGGDFTVVISSYKNGALVKAETVKKGDMSFNNGVYSYNITQKSENADKVKIFLFNSLSNIKPLTYYVELK